MTQKIFIDARLLKAITDVSKYHFPLLPVQGLIPRIDGTIFSTTDLSTAYHQVASRPETPKLVHFVVENKICKYKRGVYGLKTLPVFFTRVITILSPPLIKKYEIITHIDDILILNDN